MKALAFNMASAGISNYLSSKLEIINDAGLKTSSIKNIFSSNLIKKVTDLSLDAIIHNRTPHKLSDVVIPFVVDVFG